MARRKERELGGGAVQQRPGAAAGPRLRLLGGWQLQVAGEDLALNHREQRLVALLGLTGRSARAHVAGTLWPESTDARALASLRRAVLQTQRRCPGLLRADRAEVGLAPDVTVDVDELRRTARLTERPVSGAGADALVPVLAGEPLLPEWYDDWVLPEREHLEQLRVKALERIARQALGGDDPVRAIEAAGAALDVEPLLEPARELMIRAHLALGDRGSALREFHRYRDAMRDELEAPPSAAIRALVEPVLAGQAATAGPQGARSGTGAGPSRGRPVTEPAALGLEDLHVPITPVTQAAIPPPDPRGRTSAAPPPPVRRPPSLVGPGGADGPGGPGGTRGRRAAVRLLAVAVLVLAVSLTLAGGVDSLRGDPDVSGGALLPTEGDVPRDSGARPGPGAGGTPAPARRVVVHPARSSARSAVLLVRATRRPATVRVRMRGPAGSVLRSMVVRSRDGRRLVLGGLDPGTYRWWVTAPRAAPVTGRVRVADDPPEPPREAAAAPAQTIVPAPTATPLSSASSPAPPAPSPTRQPTTAPTAAPAPTTTTPQTPVPHPTHPPPTPAGQPSPTGDPTDPGTQDPTPVG